MAVCGCAQPSSDLRLPGDTVEQNNAAEVVEIGDEVNIFLTSGGTERGVIEQISLESISVGRAGNYGYATTSIKYDDISRIEKIGHGGLWSLWPVVPIAVGAVAFGYVYSLLSMPD